MDDDIAAQSFGTVPGQVSKFAQTHPSHPALIQGGRSVTYADLNAIMDRVAAALQRDSIQPREIVGISAGDSIEYLTVFLGALRAGVAVAPLPKNVTPKTLSAMIQDAEIRLLFVDAASRSSLPVPTKTDRTRLVALDGSEGVQSFLEWLPSETVRPRVVDIQPDFPFNVIYSSGTTGIPKGILHSCAMRWAHVKQASSRGYGVDSILLAGTPLYSNLTLMSVFQCLARGGTIVLMQKFEPGNYLALVKKHLVSHTVLVGVQYERLMAHPDFSREIISTLRVKLTGGAPMSPALKGAILDSWPGELYEAYGVSEGGGICILAAHVHRDKLHTVGKPVPGHEFRIIDENGAELPQSQIGEIIGRSPQMMTGYFNNRISTADAEWFDAAGRRFIRSGDIGRFDDDGFLVLLGRAKDMIISGGFNIYPKDIEEVLETYPDILEVAVVGVRSEKWGETPIAFVAPKLGTAPEPAAILSWVNARVGKLQRLAGIELIDQLPRNAVGKILKRELRETYETRHQSH